LNGAPQAKLPPQLSGPNDLVAAGEQAEEAESFEARLDFSGIEGGHGSSLLSAS
jgi:hypothetical protein